MLIWPLLITQFALDFTCCFSLPVLYFKYIFNRTKKNHILLKLILYRCDFLDICFFFVYCPFPQSTGKSHTVGYLLHFSGSPLDGWLISIPGQLPHALIVTYSPLRYFCLYYLNNALNFSVFRSLMLFCTSIITPSSCCHCELEFIFTSLAPTCCHARDVSCPKNIAKIQYKMRNDHLSDRLSLLTTLIIVIM